MFSNIKMLTIYSGDKAGTRLTFSNASTLSNFNRSDAGAYVQFLSLYITMLYK